VQGEAPDTFRPLIDVEGLSKSFHVRRSLLPAFTSISFAVPAGQFVSILGPSGCGKSRLLQVMAGLQPASGGSVRFHGEPVLDPPRGMIYVFQQYSKSVFPWRTVAQNVAFGLERLRLPQTEMKARIGRIVSLVGLADTRTIFRPNYLAACSSASRWHVPWRANRKRS
jgi:NitT/TauT family transport system ATP-binding protein